MQRMKIVAAAPVVAFACVSLLRLDSALASAIALVLAYYLGAWVALLDD